MKDSDRRIANEVRGKLISAIDEFVVFGQDTERRIEDQSWKGHEIFEERFLKFWQAGRKIATTLASLTIDVELLFSDADTRVPLFALAGLSMGVSQMSRLSDQDAQKVFRMAQTHPVRALREAARIYLFEAKFLSPSPAIQRAWGITEKRELVMLGHPEDHTAWVAAQLHTQVWSTLSTDNWYTKESSLFPGESNRWMLQTAYPLMAVLFRSGPLSAEELMCVELNAEALASSLQHLISIGEVTKQEIKQGLFAKPKVVFTLARPGYWSGPPF